MIIQSKQVVLRLRKDLSRSIKRGHAWLYSGAFDVAGAETGCTAIVEDRKGQRIACGIYSPDHPIPVRICRTVAPFRLDDEWLISQLSKAIDLRRRAFTEETTGFRLVAGEGDGLPGLIVDCYDRTAVIKLDGGSPEVFYQPLAIAEWLRERLKLNCVVLRSRSRGEAAQVLCGDLDSNPVPFLENGMNFTADILHGQKTGFFLDQRDNRNLVRSLSRGMRVLNLFSFSGGFSIAAGMGGAERVTSVDIAKPAIEAASRHWDFNGLDSAAHVGEAADCFEFLESAAKGRTQWDLVICDPPSFAPSEKAREKAIPAYGRLAQLAAKVTKPVGLLGLASCSSHISSTEFSTINAEALGRARRRPTLIAQRGLPVDHPTPLAMPELRYLKFQMFRLD